MLTVLLEYIVLLVKYTMSILLDYINLCKLIIIETSLLVMCYSAHDFVLSLW